MTKLEKLIQELCPNGVKHCKIKDIYKRVKGTPITAGKMKEIAVDDGEIKYLQVEKLLLQRMNLIFQTQISQGFRLFWYNPEALLTLFIMISPLPLRMKCGLIQQMTLSK